MGWTKIWKQAMTRSLPLGLGVPHKMTIIFPLFCPVTGSRIRIRLNNESSKKTAHIKGITVQIGNVIYDMTQNGKRHIIIPAGSSVYTDQLEVPVEAGETLSVRLLPLTKANDLNSIETEAFAYKEDFLHETQLPVCPKTAIERKYKINKMMPYIDSVDVFCEHDFKCIVAFGDSITAMSRWTKPLAKRLYELYGGEYVLLNAGISGNCLAYARKGLFGSFFGTRGVDRFDKDVLPEEHVATVIISIGTNDIALMSSKTENNINVDILIEAAEKVIQKAIDRGIHIVGTNIMPLLNKDEYTPEKDSKRLIYNEWLNHYEGFDYLMDWDSLARDPEYPWVMKDYFHQGDYVHPSISGGQELADNIDISMLISCQAEYSAEGQ